MKKNLWIQRLKAFSVEKFTLDVRKFHTLTILSAKYLLRVLLTQLEVFVGMAPSSSYPAQFKKKLKNLSLLHQRRSYNNISNPSANVVILDSANQDCAVFHCMTCVWVPAVFLWKKWKNALSSCTHLSESNERCVSILDIVIEYSRYKQD